MSDWAASLAGLEAHTAPRSKSGFAFSALRFQITGFCPWSKQPRHHRRAHAPDAAKPDLH